MLGPYAQPEIRHGSKIIYMYRKNYGVAFLTPRRFQYGFYSGIQFYKKKKKKKMYFHCTVTGAKSYLLTLIFDLCTLQPGVNMCKIPYDTETG